MKRKLTHRLFPVLCLGTLTLLTVATPESEHANASTIAYGYYTPNGLPDILDAYAENPEDLGIMWGSETGWPDHCWYNQSTDLVNAHMVQLYGVSDIPNVNAKDLAHAYADLFGGVTSTTPDVNAVFSNSTDSVYGHTGIVQHVFDNGDILIIEQNVNGYSGAGNDTSSTWSYRLVEASQYTAGGWTFFKPDQ